MIIKKTIFRIVTLLSLFLSMYAIFYITSNNIDKPNTFKYKELLKSFILKKIIDVNENVPKSIDVVYILGGSQNSLMLKFIAALKICNKQNCKRILMLSRPGITQYSETLKRNLTNDEWAMEKIKKLGLSADKIDFIAMEDGFFGTYNEAKNISRLIIKNNYKNVVLISAPYHTKRVRASFEKYLNKDSTNLYLLGTEEKGSIIDLAVEYFKLTLYQLLLV